MEPLAYELHLSSQLSIGTQPVPATVLITQPI